MTCPSSHYGTTVPILGTDLADVWRICDELRVPIGDALAEAVHLGIPLLVDKLMALDVASERRGFLEQNAHDAATAAMASGGRPESWRD